MHFPEAVGCSLLPHLESVGCETYLHIRQHKHAWLSDRGIYSFNAELTTLCDNLKILICEKYEKIQSVDIISPHWKGRNNWKPFIVLGNVILYLCFF